VPAFTGSRLTPLLALPQALRWELQRRISRNLAGHTVESTHRLNPGDSCIDLPGGTQRVPFGRVQVARHLTGRYLLQRGVTHRSQRVAALVLGTDVRDRRSSWRRAASRSDHDSDDDRDEHDDPACGSALGGHLCLG